MNNAFQYWSESRTLKLSKILQNYTCGQFSNFRHYDITSLLVRSLHLSDELINEMKIVRLRTTWITVEYYVSGKKSISCVRRGKQKHKTSWWHAFGSWFLRVQGTDDTTRICSTRTETFARYIFNLHRRMNHIWLEYSMFLTMYFWWTEEIGKENLWVKFHWTIQMSIFRGYFSLSASEIFFF